MTMSDPDTLKMLTAQIVSAHVANNSVPTETLPALIHSVFASLQSTSEPVAESVKELIPAVPVKRSVFPDYIVCLEDGKKLKMLKRHLLSGYGLTPDDYRKRWGLPSDYPMVAPNYAEQRSTLARQIGLGRKTSIEPARDLFRASDDSVETIEGVDVTKIPEKKRGRGPARPKQG